MKQYYNYAWIHFYIYTHCNNILLFILAHATSVFKGKMWLTGGRTDAYTMYNLETSYKAGDVWYSAQGGIYNIIYNDIHNVHSSHLLIFD